MLSDVKPKTLTECKVFYSSNRNKILIGRVIYSERHVPDAHLCIKYCMISDNCQSINYNSVTKVCQLNNATLPTLDDKGICSDKRVLVLPGSTHYACVIGFPEVGDPRQMWGLCKRLVQLPHLLWHYFSSNPHIDPWYLGHCSSIGNMLIWFTFQWTQWKPHRAMQGW